MSAAHHTLPADAREVIEFLELARWRYGSSRIVPDASTLRSGPSATARKRDESCTAS